MTETIVEIVEKFLAYSDEKLEELAKKNQALKIEEKDTKN